MENRNKLIGGGVIPPPVFPEFIKNIDWKLLREQKYLCLQFIEAGYEMGRKVPDAVQGLIHLVDAIQDYATDVMGLTDKEVFDLTPEDEDVPFLYVDGYWKDDKSEFHEYKVSTSDDDFEDDDTIFFYGLSESEVIDAISQGIRTIHDFVITSYHK